MRQIAQAAAFVVGCLCFVSGAWGVDYPYKSAKDFKTLNVSPTVKDFEESYGEYVQRCLDNTFGGTGGIPCFIGDELWDRELNTYYKLLMSKLDESGRSLLKKSQQEWLKSRDLSNTLGHYALDTRYKEPGGTLQLLTRAGEFNEPYVAMVKERTLWLKYWFELLSARPEE